MTTPFRPNSYYQERWQERSMFVVAEHRKLRSIDENDGFYYGYLVLPWILAEQFATASSWGLRAETPKWIEGWHKGFEVRMSEP